MTNNSPTLSSPAKPPLTVIFALFFAIMFSPLTSVVPAFAASKIKVIVNGKAITTYDIARRAAFLKLRRVRGNRTKLATEELIDEEVKMQAANRVKISVRKKEVDAAFARFAKSNKMPVRALTQILNRSGVTSKAFKRFIRAQMTWQRLMAAKVRAESQQKSNQDIFSKLHAQGGNKPSTTEYTLQQVIFVVPKKKRRALMSKRRRQAKAFKNRFESCGKTIQFAKGLRDVTVRSLGRVMQPQLPPDWKKHIIATSEGKTTAVRDTHRGVEFIAVCRAKTVSDDRVAQLEFRADQAKQGASDSEKKYLQQLKDRATITRR